MGFNIMAITKKLKIVDALRTIVSNLDENWKTKIQTFSVLILSVLFSRPFGVKINGYIKFWIRKQKWYVLHFVLYDAHTDTKNFTPLINSIIFWNQWNHFLLFPLQSSQDVQILCWSFISFLSFSDIYYMSFIILYPSISYSGHKMQQAWLGLSFENHLIDHQEIIDDCGVPEKNMN